MPTVSLSSPRARCLAHDNHAIQLHEIVYVTLLPGQADLQDPSKSRLRSLPATDSAGTLGSTPYREPGLFRRQTKVIYLSYCLKLVKTLETTQKQILPRGTIHNFFLDKNGEGVTSYLFMQQVKSSALG